MASAPNARSAGSRDAPRLPPVATAQASVPATYHMSGGGAIAKKKPPENVLTLLANATANLVKKKKPRLIPEATLMNRIKRRRKGG